MLGRPDYDKIDTIHCGFTDNNQFVFRNGEKETQFTVSMLGGCNA